ASAADTPPLITPAPLPEPLPFPVSPPSPMTSPVVTDSSGHNLITQPLIGPSAFGFPPSIGRRQMPRGSPVTASVKRPMTQGLVPPSRGHFGCQRRPPKFGASSIGMPRRRKYDSPSVPSMATVSRQMRFANSSPSGGGGGVAAKSSSSAKSSPSMFFGAGGIGRVGDVDRGDMPVSVRTASAKVQPSRCR